jgi:hypothetical protein
MAQLIKLGDEIRVCALKGCNNILLPSARKDKKCCCSAHTKRLSRQENHKKGLCMTCGVRPITFGRSKYKCNYCLDKGIETHNRKRKGEYKGRWPIDYIPKSRKHIAFGYSIKDIDNDGWPVIITGFTTTLGSRLVDYNACNGRDLTYYKTWELNGNDPQVELQENFAYLQIKRYTDKTNREIYYESQALLGWIDAQ